MLTRYVLVVYIVGGSRDIDHSPSVVLYLHVAACVIGHVTVALHLVAQRSLQLGSDTFMVYALNGGSYAVVTLGIRGGVGGRVLDGKRTQRVGLKSHHDDAVRHRGKGGATIVMSVVIEADTRQGRGKVEFAMVVAHLTGVNACMGHLQTAQREILHAVRSLDELLVYQVLSLLFLAVEDEAAHLFQICFCCGAVVIMWTSTPERVFVQLNLFCLRAAIDHSSQSAVAYGECLQPDGGRFVVPQAFRIVAVLRLHAYRKECGDNG